MIDYSRKPVTLTTGTLTLTLPVLSSLLMPDFILFILILIKIWLQLKFFLCRNDLQKSVVVLLPKQFWRSIWILIKRLFWIKNYSLADVHGFTIFHGCNLGFCVKKKFLRCISSQTSLAGQPKQVICEETTLTGDFKVQLYLLVWLSD